MLAGGSGTRLYPITLGVSKQLLPIHDKPMVFYPLSVLMLAKIKDVLIICDPNDLQSYTRLLGDGKDLGMKITYEVQKEPNGIAEAFIIGKEFIGNDMVALILGDNIFYGADFSKLLTERIKKSKKGATVFGYHVADPERFGVVQFNDRGKVLSIEEKPVKPKSNYAVVGLYFYDSKVVEYSENLDPSKRGELEITDLNNVYLKKNQLHVTKLDKGFAWLDTGTPESLQDAGQFVSTIEKRQGIKIGCIDEVAYRNSWISKKQLSKNSEKYKGTDYANYLKQIVKEK